MDLIPGCTPAACVYFPNFSLSVMFEKVQVNEFLSLFRQREQGGGKFPIGENDCLTAYRNGVSFSCIADNNFAKPWKVYMMCSLYASVQVIENSLLSSQNGIARLTVAFYFSCFCDIIFKTNGRGEGYAKRKSYPISV